ncbi:MAG: hypothetical protein N4A72_08235 [Bacteroidales bacterium]|jgi:hypothetical protein|nr:hypothetical protein [Bacteroidales bacterium]
MIFIPYSKVVYISEYSTEEVRRLLSEKFSIALKSDESDENNGWLDYMFMAYEGTIGDCDFEIIERKMGNDVFTLSIIGTIEVNSNKTVLKAKIIFNHNYWFGLLIIFLITGSLATGVYIASRIIGELNTGFWSLLNFNLFAYSVSLIAYHIKRIRMNYTIVNLLNATKLKCLRNSKLYK